MQTGRAGSWVALLRSALLALLAEGSHLAAQDETKSPLLQTQKEQGTSAVMKGSEHGEMLVLAAIS